ncbi:hypothetical protein BDE02_02G155700 [Populus trichocarpa]|nr:hypothetical protein BDE02_02G155700 [Populus trichocarpa]
MFIPMVWFFCVEKDWVNFGGWLMGRFWGCRFVFGLIGMEERLSGFFWWLTLA